MLMTLITWLYAGITIFLLGMGVDAFVEKVFHYRIKKLDSILMAGIVVATVYAQVFSLFYKVGFVANVFLIINCLIIFCFRYKKIKENAKVWANNSSTGYKLILLFLIIIWSYFTSRGYIHYDTDLYHAQSIRWLEEYGVVPGLANLHERFAYNSSFFALSALYSMKFVLQESMHTMNGFIAIVLSLTCIPIAQSWKRKYFVLSDYARIGAIYYLTVITNEVVSPCSDYSVMMILFFIVIKWLDLLRDKEKEIAPYALLCVIGVYAITLKLTAGLILILVLKPAYMLLKEKKAKEILIYLGIGLLVAIPWFARTIIISGWLLYPFTGIDLFEVDWKLDKALVEADAMQIKVWGRALYAIGYIDVPIIEWFRNWFISSLTTMDKILIIGAIGFGIAVPVITIVCLVGKRKEQADLVLVMITMLASYIFWQTSAPLMRYGYAYVLLLIFVVLGWIMENIFLFTRGVINKIVKMSRFAIYVLFLLFGLYKISALGKYISTCYLANCYIWQEEYGTYELEEYEINGVKFYYPISGDRTGYESFPASGIKVNLEFRGETMEEGFRKVR